MEISKVKLGLMIGGAVVAGFFAYRANEKRKLDNAVDGLITSNPDLFS